MKDFASDAAFIAHREFTEDPADWTRRSCMAVESDPHWVQDKNGRWTTAKLAAQAKKLREYHRDAA